MSSSYRFTTLHYRTRLWRQCKISSGANGSQQRHWYWWSPNAQAGQFEPSIWMWGEAQLFRAFCPRGALATDVMGWEWATGTATIESAELARRAGRPRSAYAEQSPRGGGHAASSRRCPCRRADPGAARRPGRRPRGLVGEGLQPRGGRGGQGDRRRLRAEDRQAGRTA